MSGIHPACVSRTSVRSNSPRVVFSASWLAGMGFIPDALVQYFPEDGGLSFVLCNENIPLYSELFRDMKQKGGTLLQVYYCRQRDNLQLCISGSQLDRTGLAFGDKLIAKYEYGYIRMRKLLDNNTKIVTPHLVGKWLSGLGFSANEVFTVAAEPGLITCTLHENGLERTAELVKLARANQLKLLQVQHVQYKHDDLTFIDIPSDCIKKAGFALDDTFIANYEYGLIKLQKPDFVGLGF
jgi:hypothetical protein